MLAATLFDVHQVCCAVKPAEFCLQSCVPLHFPVPRELPGQSATVPPYMSSRQRCVSASPCQCLQVSSLCLSVSVTLGCGGARGGESGLRHGRRVAPCHARSEMPPRAHATRGPERSVPSGLSVSFTHAQVPTGPQPSLKQMHTTTAHARAPERVWRIEWR